MTYVIDRTDRIVSADERWDAFARVNNGPLRDAIVGRPLWPHLSDVNTMQIWRHLLERVRAGRSVQLTIRCDAPAVRRTVELVVTAAAANAVRFDTRVTAEADRPAIALLDPCEPRANHLVSICSWCHAVRLGSAWVPLEVAVHRDQLFKVQGATPAVTHGICGDCEKAMSL